MRRLPIFLLLVLSLLLPGFGAVDIAQNVITSDNVLFDDGNGFESPWSPTSNAGNWDSFNGTPVSEASIVADGSVSMELNSASTYMNKDIETVTEIWIRFAFYATTTTAFHNVVELLSTGADYLEIAIQASGSNELRVFDSTTNWDSPTAISDATQYYAFIHIKLNGDGASTVQIGQNSTKYWDAWDYDTSAATIVPANFTSIKFGYCNAQGADTDYFDTFSAYKGASMPADWSAP